MNDNSKMIIMTKRLLIMLILFTPLALFAAPDRETELYRQIRCIVCQGQSLAESHSEMAVAMKQVIQQQLTSGKTDEEIKAYLVKQYGQTILFEPPMASYTWFLWFGPLLMLLFGALGLFLWVRRSPLNHSSIVHQDPL
jgi:cytochrome c-type biogenesis protein CcmH